MSTRHGRDMRKANSSVRPKHLKLPRGVEETFARRLAACEAAWREGKNSLAVAEAITWVWSYRQTIPDWLEQAAVMAIVAQLTRKEANRLRENAKHGCDGCT
jgi:hypothetical protein